MSENMSSPLVATGILVGGIMVHAGSFVHDHKNMNRCLGSCLAIERTVIVVIVVVVVGVARLQSNSNSQDFRVITD